jgi:probable HAF family extracellular repeat protein
MIPRWTGTFGFVFLLLTGFLTTVSAQAGQTGCPSQYTFSQIDLPGAEGTIAQGINEPGDIVGIAFGVDASGWILSGGSFTTYQLGEPGSTEINGINNRGLAVGDYFGVDGKLHGFTLFQGVASDADFPGAAFTLPVQPNDRGLVSGAYTNDPTFESGFHGYVWSAGVFTSFDRPGPGVTDTFAFGNNNRGEIVGIYFDESGGHSFLLSQGTFTDIAFPGAVYTQSMDISERGDIVGHYQTTPGLPAFLPEHGFLLCNGEFVTVDYPGAAATRLFTINDRGQIVGWFIDTNGDNHGFLATPQP